MTRNVLRLFATLAPALALGFACDLPPAPIGEDPEAMDDGDDDDGPGMSTTSSADDGGDAPGMCTTGGADDGDDAPGASDDGDDAPGTPDAGGDGGGGDGCDPIAQDCPAGEACYPDGDAFGCTEPAQAPAQDGDACSIHTDCDIGLFCVADVCVPVCVAGLACPDPGKVCEPWYDEGAAPPDLENVGICLDPASGGAACDPIAQDCPANEGCYPGGAAFECAAIGAAQEGEACAAHGDCDIGLLCGTDSACRPPCDVDGVSTGCQAMGHTCEPYFREGAAPPGYEQIGTCYP